MKTIVIPKKFNAANFIFGLSFFTVATLLYPAMIYLTNYQLKVIPIILFITLQILIIISLFSFDLNIAKRFGLDILYKVSKFKYIEELDDYLLNEKIERKEKYNEKMEKEKIKYETKIEDIETKIYDLQSEFEFQIEED